MAAGDNSKALEVVEATIELFREAVVACNVRVIDSIGVVVVAPAVARNGLNMAPGTAPSWPRRSPGTAAATT